MPAAGYADLHVLTDDHVILYPLANLKAIQAETFRWHC
jgi:hypothetical protein